jgi:hypothetical protein
MLIARQFLLVEHQLLFIGDLENAKIPRGMNCLTLTTTFTFPASSPPIAPMLSLYANSEARSDGAEAVDSKGRRPPRRRASNAIASSKYVTFLTTFFER